jgi:hypothetical protein
MLKFIQPQVYTYAKYPRINNNNNNNNNNNVSPAGIEKKNNWYVGFALS